ncbi:ATP-binding protein [Achromobacter arsenitoxydans]|uniref:Putative ATPase n=1 Tax=Achromobacter arsenitoxydans SY8 TaxID=477184 RepID=H0FAS7_9BURK|nr:ATP-binding protein [Achromobacter arsenitoxydans]EHK64595.1 putative ATPase [Achromobacter arsenitoxydans SY8]
MNARAPLPWTDANQQLLAAEFARLRARLEKPGEPPPRQDAQQLAQARAALDGDGAADQLSAAFGLSAFERDLLLLCAGVEMDAGLADLCAQAQGRGGGLRHASFSLALGALDGAHWSALSPQRPLRRWRLLDVDDTADLSTARLRIEERVLHFLAGLNELDVRLRPLLRPTQQLAHAAPAHTAAAQRIADWIAAEDGGPLPVYVLEGDDPGAQEDVAARAARAAGLSCLTMQAEDIPTAAAERDALLTLWQRDAVLLGAALHIEAADALPPAARQFAEQAGGLCFLAVREPVSLRAPSRHCAVSRPQEADRLALWRQALGPEAAAHAGAGLEQAASQFGLDSRSLQLTAAALAPQLQDSAADSAALLWQACAQASRRRLDGLAQRLAPAARWDDLVLPEPQLSVLRQIAAHLRQRYRVHQDWGFAAAQSRGLGLATLFTGESGTGKTMAAEALARETGLDLYRIDLSAVISKYIGETEKNLRRLFEAAEDGGAILLFDEADALFGKRSEVKDSHDRYANIEISYLLQRMESYRGLAVLTTNLKSNLDGAFLRRLRFVVQFPFPDLEQRARIWGGVFPAATPTRGLDPRQLARLNLTGGSIRNVALNAAFLAADAGTEVTMAHVLQAAHAEAAKRERPLADAETRGWP